MANDLASNKELGEVPSIQRSASVRQVTFGKSCENDSDIVPKDVPAFAVVVGKPAGYCAIGPHERMGSAMHDIRTLGAAEFCARHEPGIQSGR